MCRDTVQAATDGWPAEAYWHRLLDVAVALVLGCNDTGKVQKRQIELTAGKIVSLADEEGDTD